MKLYALETESCPNLRNHPEFKVQAPKQAKG